MPFPYTFPFVFGEGGAPSGLTKITDHADAAVSRLTEQYRDKPLMVALVRITGNRIQRLEDELWKIYEERWLSTASGEQLDVLGRLIGQPRFSFDDSDYRLYLQARIRLNRSSGTAEDLLSIFTLITPAGTGIEFVPRYPAGFRLMLDTTGFTEAAVTLLLSFLRAGRGAGIYGVIHWITGTEADTFTFAGAGGLGFGSTAAPGTGGKLAGISS